LKRGRSILLVACILASVATPGCLKGEGEIVPLDSPQVPARGFFMGILPTPAEGENLSEAYSEASKTCDFVPVWGRPTPFHKLAGELSGDWGKRFVGKLVRGKGMFPVVHMSFFDLVGGKLVLVSPPGITNATLSDPTWRRSYIESVRRVVEASHPLYISLGNEVNRWYEQEGLDRGNPNGFQYWVSLYEKAYDEVKSLSPRTKVFCVFSREIVDQNREADLKVLELFDAEKLDLLVFTSYPFAVKGINKPEDIPDDYFSRAYHHLAKMPIGFSELGWIVHPAFGGEAAQSEFLKDLVSRLTREQGLDLELVGWNWLHDLEGGDTTGLIYRNGTRKAAYSTWKEISGGGLDSAKQGRDISDQ